MDYGSAELYSPAIGAAGTVLRYGHYGRPVLVLPSEQGKAHDFADNGMVGAVAGLLDAGRAKLYCVDSYDSMSLAATTGTGYGPGCRCCWSAGRASGRTRPARWSRPSGWPASSPRKASGTSWTCGATTYRMTGRHGAPSSPTTYRASARSNRVHCGSSHWLAARHRGRLAPGVRGAGPPARQGDRRRRHHAPDHHRAGHHRTVQPALPAPALAGHRPARVLVLPPA